MKVFQMFSMAAVIAMIALSSCSSSKKAADSASSSELSMIDQKVQELAANSNFTEKTTEVKVPEKATISIWSDAEGQIQKITKVAMTPGGEKRVDYFFSDNNLVYSYHTTKNSLKQKGKTIFEDTKYYFGNNKLLSAMSRTTNVSSKSLDEAEAKIAKSKFKSFTPTINVLRDELAVIKKLKQTVK
ncbi:MAG: hypothetical protein IPQ10_02130 [Saprospiraceae bacterium]|nr:hypothetical protein [Saprospiraceae bacterium]MBK7796744.1 hypothetical protein [Saprospiraceae bacterium]MBL0259868.1 hypothetical protein [Saprospiraceae bacterium]